MSVMLQENQYVALGEMFKSHLCLIGDIEGRYVGKPFSSGCWSILKNPPEPKSRILKWLYKINLYQPKRLWIAKIMFYESKWEILVYGEVYREDLNELAIKLSEKFRVLVELVPVSANPLQEVEYLLGPY